MVVEGNETFPLSITRDSTANVPVHPPLGIPIALLFTKSPLQELHCPTHHYKHLIFSQVLYEALFCDLLVFASENMAFTFVDEVDGLSKVIQKIIMLFFGVHRRAKFIDFSLNGLKNNLQFLATATLCTLINGSASTGG